MIERNAQSPAECNSSTPMRFDPLALATLVGVVVVLSISFWNLRSLKSLQERVGGIEARIGPPRPSGPDPNRIHTINLEGAATKGPDTAQVTIVEFSDFQCPFCARAVPTLKQIEDTYTGRVRIVWKHLPLSIHKDAMGAALAAEVARKQGKFWEFHDRLFANQNQLGPDDLKQYAQDLQLDMTRFEADLLNVDEKKKIDADVAEAVTLGITGTPGFFVNGRFINGAQPFETFAKVIDEELMKARQ